MRSTTTTRAGTTISEHTCRCETSHVAGDTDLPGAYVNVGCGTEFGDEMSMVSALVGIDVVICT